MDGMPVDMAMWVIVPVAVLLVIGGVAWQFSRSRTILEQWAAENGYQILERERRYMRLGPFWWRTGKNQQVYYVRVRDGSGRERSGYVRCGSWLAGMLSSQATVAWDDER